MHAIRIPFCFLVMVTLLCRPASLAAQAAEGPSLELRAGDRVTLLGGAFVEQLQQTGYLETVLTSRMPNRDVTFRNLGWSGDTVWGEARAVFGSQPQGFERLLSDMKLTEPTVILIAYGNNEAFAGEAGLPRFEQGLNHLLDKLAETGARLALVSPLERENLGPPLPDPSAYNEQVKQYGAALARIAAERGLPYVELNPLARRDAAHRPAAADQQLTHDSLTLTTYGAWLTADRIAAALGLPAKPLEITVDLDRGEARAEGAAVSDFAAADGRWQFALEAEQLPYPALPRHAPPGAEAQAPRSQLAVAGSLDEGTYRLLVDGEEVARGSSDQWRQGISLAGGPEREQAARLRKLINTKNELFFNRHRPQNETYLFLFRKHEQGNNAVEIPQFDPLIESREHEIAELAAPVKRRYVLEKID